MAEETKLNEFERSYAGCYGSQVTCDGLDEFLQDVFTLNEEADNAGGRRFASCIWGHAGIGKTQKVKDYASKSVKWNGQTYEGYKVFDVPIAQFEEMGDLHGMPDKHVFMRNNGDSRWVAEAVIQQYAALNWEIDESQGIRTMYAPPDWVPSTPGPAILLLDDWNRASIRIIKGIMQLLQNYGMVSWKLPPGCNIVLTGNPDEQDYLVTSIDSAILTRIKSITLQEDAPEWAIWAEANNLDKRGISFILRYPEMMCGKERTNPRTLSEFFRFLRTVNGQEGADHRIMMQANSLLDQETVSAMMVFFKREMEMIIEPEQILEGDNKAGKHVHNLMNRKEKRIDVLSVICERLFARIVQPDCEQTDERIKNFQDFITMDDIPDDMRHSICRRMGKRKDEGRTQRWLVGNTKLKKLILETLH